MAESELEITETDAAGNVRATYVQSSTTQDGLRRVDVIPPPNAKPLPQRLLDVFLPVGYPHSVTSDYLEYQVYDSLQAFSSSIAGMLSSRAVLSSVGVGDSTASPTAALLLSVLQETFGRIATILFAHRFGTSLEPECKMYRLLADVLNDIAFVLDCLSPAFPKPVRVVVLSFSSVLRALCGVAAGSAKASLSAHFARRDNLGELNAKDSSQETVISLLGMLAGSLVVSWVTTPTATWTALILLLSIHLETNRRAVRAVQMRTLNRQRATLVFHHLRRGHVPTPKEVSKEERIFERDGVLRSSNGRVLGYCNIGSSISRLFNSVGTQHSSTRSACISTKLLPAILSLYDDQGYVLWYTGNSVHRQFDTFLRTNAMATDLLIAWWHALTLANSIEAVHDPEKPIDREEQKLATLEKTLAAARNLFDQQESSLIEAGWVLNTTALETQSSTRFGIDG